MGSPTLLCALLMDLHVSRWCYPSFHNCIISCRGFPPWLTCKVGWPIWSLVVVYPSSAFDHGIHCYACAQIQQGISLHNKQKALVPIIYQLPQLGWTTFHVALDLMITYDYPSNVQLLYMGYVGATNNHQKS
jgi:hypothetical protein